ncbi:MAG: hypothetical protein IJ588_03800 [Prevotella sp.]|nr:hypothetical protein [Prevotella sp.]
MKHDYDISKQFQDDLIKAYNSVAMLSWSQEEAYKKAVKQPAPRYYVSPKQAAQVLAPMIRGDFERVNMMIPNKRRMYYSLFDKVIELSEKRAFVGKSLIFIVQYAVISPAPEFFCSHERLHAIRSLIKTGKLDLEGKCAYYPANARAYEKLKKRRAEIQAHRAKFRSQPQS